MKEYFEKVEQLIKDINDQEDNNIKKAALLMYQAMRKELLVHVFATGHSHMFAEELFYRAGGLVQINPILIPPLMQHEGAVRSTQLERKPGYAKQIFDELDIKKDEVFIIVSNSGINSVPVEFASIVKEHHHPLIVITSMEMTKKVNPRNNLNKKLYEFGDVVIDNHAPYGDGIIEKAYGRIGAVSSIAGNYIAQSLVLEVINLYEQDGLTPPIYLSSNTPGGDEHNRILFEKYQKRIKSLY